jgi:hypothetical protein
LTDINAHRRRDAEAPTIKIAVTCPFGLGVSLRGATMIQSLKLILLLVAFAAAPAFAAQPDPHHPDAQSSAPAGAAAAEPAKGDTGHGCPMAGDHMAAGGHMMGGQGHMSGATGMHCGPDHHSAKGSTHHGRGHHGARHHGARHHHPHHGGQGHAAPKPAK